jgi:hypothetical protein
MKNYTVRSGDTLSKIILFEYGLTNNIGTDLLDCLIRYIATINGKDVSLYDNINTNRIEDPDSLKPNQVLTIPNDLNEVYADPLWQQFACAAPAPSTLPSGSTGNNMQKWWWIGGGLLALGAIYFLTKKKKGKRR